METMLKKIRCSHLPRIMACPASAATPGLDIDAGDESADLGTAVHEGLADLIQRQAKGEAVGLDDVDLYVLSETHNVDADELRFLLWRGWSMWGEISNRLDSVQCEVELEATLQHVILTGHADVLAVVMDKAGCLLVIDWKSGRKEKNYLAQLMGYALAALKQFPYCTRALVAIGWLRTGVLDVHEYDRAALEAFEHELDKSVTSECVRYCPAEGICLYCPLQMECQARRALITSAGEDMRAIMGAEPTTALTPAVLAALYPKSRMLKKALESYEHAMRAAIRINGGPIACEGGEIGLIDSVRMVITYAPEVLGEFMSAEAVRDLRPTVTKGNLEKAVSDAAPRGQKGVAKEACIAALKKAGAIEEKPCSSLDYRSAS